MPTSTMIDPKNLNLFDLDQTTGRSRGPPHPNELSGLKALRQFALDKDRIEPSTPIGCSVC
jgi:hypothetical protein